MTLWYITFCKIPSLYNPGSSGVVQVGLMPAGQRKWKSAWLYSFVPSFSAVPAVFQSCHLCELSLSMRKLHFYHLVQSWPSVKYHSIITLMRLWDLKYRVKECRIYRSAFSICVVKCLTPQNLDIPKWVSRSVITGSLHFTRAQRLQSAFCWLLGRRSRSRCDLHPKQPVPKKCK